MEAQTWRAACLALPSSPHAAVPPHLPFHSLSLMPASNLPICPHSCPPALPLPLQINLTPDKKRVLSEVYRVLAPGGEMYFRQVGVGWGSGSRWRSAVATTAATLG